MPQPKGSKAYLLNDNFFNPKKFKEPEEMAVTFLQYITELKENPLIKKEPIKSGDNAGTCMDVELQRVPTIKGFCAFCGFTEKTFLNYSNAEGYESFFQVSNNIRNNIQQMQLDLTLVGLANSSIVARLQGLTDKREETVTKKKIVVTVKNEEE